ncbi:trehalose-6-phosphate synthase [Enterovirga sp. DB1703]|uniref:Trehalose-6-phosphate synthase n=2 Tax=Enterovirga aerilata TaxID=2730920 RepID=A0A849I3U3_9HYPH|nr:trehalose-6-phosphate synthase [Enterovirga sp. DB1703]
MKGRTEFTSAVLRPAGQADSSTESPSELPRRRGRSRESRLVVVSNRVPVPGRRGAGGAGGLAVALEAALKEHGGVWFGWSGDARPAIDADALDEHQVGRINFAVTDLTKRDVEEYYLGFSNRALWPVCHYRLDLAHFSERDTAAYFRVNGFLARKLVRLLEPGDLVWVHDYHMIPMGSELRARGFGGRLGFFLHIPWPCPEIASALPEYRRLLADLTAYDVIGFQTPRDAENFGRCLAEEGLAKHLGVGWYEAQGRRVQVGAFPIGIDTDAFRQAAAKAENLPAVKRFVSTLGQQKLMIGVDRLDYSKGIDERIKSFCAYLDAHPEERGRVTYLQVTPKSRSDVPEYKQIQQEVAGRVGEANGAYGTVDWTPIRYLNQNIPHVTLTGLYRSAQVGLVTPLRDGMNLVAKEYVASQSPDNPGVLVLSRYAGAAFELDGAVIVNPYDAAGTASGIARAFAMSLAERRERWSAMMRHLETHTVNDWWRSFLDTLARGDGSPSEHARGMAGATA